MVKFETDSQFLVGLLHYNLTPLYVRNEVLICLITLTEDSKKFSGEILAHHLEKLLSIKDSEDYIAVTACGVLHNSFVSMKWYDHNTPKAGISDAVLIPKLVQYLEPIGDSSNGANGQSGQSKTEQVLRLALEIIASIASSLQEALEHGVSYEKEFEGFDNSELAEGVEGMNAEEADGDGEDVEGDEDFEMTQDEMDADMAMVLGEKDDSDPSGETEIEEVTLDRLIRLAAPKVLVLTRPDPEGPIQDIARAALTNIAWTVSSIDFSSEHLQSLKKFWVSLSQLIWNELVRPHIITNDLDVNDASTIMSLAWALARSVKNDIEMQSDDHRRIMALYNSSRKLDHVETDAFQGLGVKCIGFLGTVATQPCSVQLNEEIGIFLLKIVLAVPDVPTADIVQALDHIFEIYADRSYPYDELVFQRHNFPRHLEEALPKLKAMAKGIDKRYFGELRQRTDEALLNLTRFLAYKRKEKVKTP